MKTFTRKQAIDLLRSELSRIADDEHSICDVAARQGIFCHGFDQYSTRDLFKKFSWIAKPLKAKSRAELLKYLNLWQLARQRVHNDEFACDVQCEERDTCLGWDTFTNEALSGYVREVCGEGVEVRDGGLETYEPCPIPSQ